MTNPIKEAKELLESAKQFGADDMEVVELSFIDKKCVYGVHANNENGSAHIKNFIEQSYETINTLIQEVEGREWIDIDTPPKEEGNYLTLDGDNDQQVCLWTGKTWVIEVALKPDGSLKGSYYSVITYSEHHLAFKITHWMPLPEPPESCKPTDESI